MNTSQGGASPRERRALLRRAARVGLISLGSCPDRNARLLAGVFCMPKLPSSSRHSCIILKGARAMSLSESDSKVFYFVLGVGPSHFEKQAWGLRVPLRAVLEDHRVVSPPPHTPKNCQPKSYFLDTSRDTIRKNIK